MKEEENFIEKESPDIDQGVSEKEEEQKKTKFQIFQKSYKKQLTVSFLSL